MLETDYPYPRGCIHHQNLPRPSYTQSSHGRLTSNVSDSSAEEKPSLDFTQRIERKLAECNASENVLKRWLFEIASWIVSAVSMGAIVGIYLWVNHKQTSKGDFLLHISNILGKVASAALIVPTSESLGQLKWNWFHNSQAMWDFEIFDKATRGPWGAAMLFFRTKGRSLAALGALLIVLLLAIDTFFQQVVIFPDRWALETTFSAKIPRIIRYEPEYRPEYKDGYELSQYDNKLLPILQEFYYGNGTQPVILGNGTRPDIPLLCPTSNCTWPPYETLAVCSRCEEVSHLLDLTYKCLNTTIDWSTQWKGPFNDVPYPNGIVCGHFINSTSSTPILMSGYSANATGSQFLPIETLLVRALPLTNMISKDYLYGTGSINFKNKRLPIIDVLISSAPAGIESVHRMEAPIINECVLSWCIQTMKSSYDRGRYSEEVITTFENTTIGPLPWRSFSVPEDQGGGGGTYIEYTQNITIESPLSGLNRSNPAALGMQYGADNITACNMINNFDHIFPSSYTTDATGKSQLVFKNYLDGPSTRTLKFNPWQAPNNISHHMERMATALTNGMRSSVNTHMLSGNAYSKETYILVRWEWLAFPFALLTLTFIFLVATISKTSKDTTTGIWKTSALPTLIYGLPKEAQSKMAPPSRWNSAEEGRKIRIKLLPNMGWRVSGQSHLSRSPRLPGYENRAPPGWI